MTRFSHLIAEFLIPTIAICGLFTLFSFVQTGFFAFLYFSFFAIIASFLFYKNKEDFKKFLLNNIKLIFTAILFYIAFLLIFLLKIS